MLGLLNSFVPKTSFLSISRCSRTISNIMSTYHIYSNRMTKFKDFRHTRTPVGLLRYKRHNTKSCQATHHLMVHVLNHQYESMTDQRCCRNGYSFSISILSNCQEQGLLFGTGTELVLQAILNPITLLQTHKSGNASLNLA